MTEQDKDTLTGIDWKITWKAVTSKRLDTTALKKALPDVAERFTKESTSKRFVRKRQTFPPQENSKPGFHLA